MLLSSSLNHVEDDWVRLVHVSTIAEHLELCRVDLGPTMNTAIVICRTEPPQDRIQLDALWRGWQRHCTALTSCATTAASTAPTFARRAACRASTPLGCL